jgi:hypothetical protein
VAIALLVLGVTLVGESLNDVLNPLLRTAKITKVILPAMSARAKSRQTQSATQERVEPGAGPSEASGPGADR